MKTTAFAATLLALGAATASPALADKHEEGSEKRAALTINSTIEELMSDEKTAAILEKHLPGIGSHSSYDQFKGWTLAELAPWSGGLVNDEVIAMIKADLEALA
ncbi:MAG: hypothetical protein AAFQ90_02440 [Pseudomonadota bacterium]